MDVNKHICGDKDHYVKVSPSFIISLASLIVLSVVGWTVLKVTEVPECYATKQSVQVTEDKLERKIYEAKIDFIRGQDEIKSGLNEFEKNVNKKFSDVGKKLTSIEEFLRKDSTEK